MPAAPESTSTQQPAVPQPSHPTWEYGAPEIGAHAQPAPGVTNPNGAQQ
jgi:hypothetical protein